MVLKSAATLDISLRVDGMTPPRNGESLMTTASATQFNAVAAEGDNLLLGLELSFVGGFRGLLAAAAHGYRPTCRAEVDERYGRLADLYDAAQALLKSKARAYRG